MAGRDMRRLDGSEHLDICMGYMGTCQTQQTIALEICVFPVYKLHLKVT